MASLQVRNVSAYYDEMEVLRTINISMEAKTITAVIGPSGCGKSTFLRLFNRMNELIKGSRIKGKIYIDDQDIYSESVRVDELRMKVGMVFQKPNPFPQSIFENVAYGLRIRGIKDKNILEEAVEKSLKKSALWEEVKDRLKDSAFSLSGGQQQRLCIARALVVDPPVLLMDEPASALDPIASAKIEELIKELKKQHTIVIVTHNMQQAARISDVTAFFYMGYLYESGPTKEFFENPQHEKTQQYVRGYFG